MESLPSYDKNTLEQRVNRDVEYILEREDEFDIPREKTGFVQMYYLSHYAPREFDTYLNNSGFDPDKIDVMDIYKKSKDLVSFVKAVYEKASSVMSEDNPDKGGDFNVGMLSFDGEYIHLGKNIKESPYSLKESLGLLAHHLLDKSINIDFIMANSWLMGNDSLRESIGFEKISEQDFDPKGGSEIWGQFIDKNGNLKRKELEFLFKNGNPRYLLTKAGLSFDEFIRKYAN